MMERYADGDILDGNKKSDRERLRALQQAWIEKWKKIILPADRHVLFLAGDLAAKWLGPRQPIIWGGDFISMKAR